MIIKLLLVAAFFNGFCWITLIPIWQYPDEQAHFAQVQLFANHGYDPFFESVSNTSKEVVLSEKILNTERDGFGNNKYTYNPAFRIEYSQTVDGYFENFLRTLSDVEKETLIKHEATSNPPLYYLFGSVVYKLLQNENLFIRVFAVRLMSLLFFLITIFISWRIALIIFPNYSLRLALPTLVAFMPMLVFSSTGVLPDTLTNLLFSLIVLMCLKILKFGGRAKYVIISVLTLVLGFLTRQQFVIALPIIFLAALFNLSKNVNFLPKALRLFILITFLIIVIAKNPFTIHYVSEIRIPDLSIFNPTKVSFKSIVEYTNFSLKTYYQQTFPWYLGVYKWLSLTLPIEYYRAFKVLTLISTLGLILGAYKLFKREKTSQKPKYFLFLIFSSFTYLLAFFVGDYFFYINNNYSFGIQGRYFFPLVTAHLALLIIGIWIMAKILLKRYASLSILLLIILMIAFNFFSLKHVAGSYYDISNLDNFLIQASQYKPTIFKGENLLYIITMAFISQIVLVVAYASRIYKLSR